MVLSLFGVISLHRVVHQNKALGIILSSSYCGYLRQASGINYRKSCLLFLKEDRITLCLGLVSFQWEE
ncbi:hypothetical protein U1Q18_032557, partial [Sarracenia purpurea var. burkii]